MRGLPPPLPRPLEGSPVGITMHSGRVLTQSPSARKKNLRKAVVSDILSMTVAMRIFWVIGIIFGLMGNHVFSSASPFDPASGSARGDDHECACRSTCCVSDSKPSPSAPPASLPTAGLGSLQEFPLKLTETATFCCSSLKSISEHPLPDAKATRPVPAVPLFLACRALLI